MDIEYKKELHALSRHYDILLWTVTTIISVAIGGLLVYYKDKEYDLSLGIVGIILPIIGIFFAGSFRRLRRQVHNELGSEHSRMYFGDRLLWQWPVFLLIFIGLDALWIQLLIHQRRDLLCWWVFVSVALIMVILCIVWCAERPIDQGNMSNTTDNK